MHPMNMEVGKSNIQQNIVWHQLETLKYVSAITTVAHIES